MTLYRVLDLTCAAFLLLRYSLVAINSLGCQKVKGHMAQLELELVTPCAAYLPDYLAALKRGWSSDNIRAEAAEEEAEEIERDPIGFIAKKADDREAGGGPVKLPDGSMVQRLPGFVRWIWDGEFCGSISFRWQKGTAELPPHVLGHIGYGVVPWKQRRGYATKALALMLIEARAEGLPYVEITTDPDNIASQKVILANRGQLIERFRKPPQYGARVECLRYRIIIDEKLDQRIEQTVSVRAKPVSDVLPSAPGRSTPGATTG
jgi:predicted acetyltransferase